MMIPATAAHIMQAAKIGKLRPMKPRAVVVLVAIAAADPPHAKIEAIAEAAGVSLSTTKRAISELRAAGWLIGRGY